MFEGFDRRQVDVGEDIRINCVLAGSGPPVLLLHGFPQNLAMWARVAPLLISAGYEVVCADLRGYGDSSKPQCAKDKTNYTFRAMADDQVKLMNELGHREFQVIGHDRGGRTAHRMALDHGNAVRSLAVLDIVPTYAMFMETNHRVSGAYWHWYFLSQPAPFPERLIANDPDFFYETCLVGWGATHMEDFDADMLADYRRCWRHREMIHGSCADYAATATRDLELDTADRDRKVACPTLALYGSTGTMASCFNIPQEWSKRCSQLSTDSLPGGHFFVDQFPEQTAQKFITFLNSSKPE